MYKDVSRNLRNYRTLRGLTIEELSNYSGLSTVTISKIENEKMNNITLGTIKRLADALNTPIESMFVQDDESEEKINEIAKKEMVDVLYPYEKSIKNRDDMMYCSAMMEFLVWLPLIDAKELYRVYNDRIQGGFLDYEKYIIDSQIRYLIEDIPDSPAKEYACNVVKAMRVLRETRNFELATEFFANEYNSNLHKAYKEVCGKKLRLMENLHEIQKIGDIY